MSAGLSAGAAIDGCLSGQKRPLYEWNQTIGRETAPRARLELQKRREELEIGIKAEAMSETLKGGRD